MLRFVLLSAIVAALLFALDNYVFRNWRRFAGSGRFLRFTIPIYRVARLVMPFTLPLYFAFSRWWEVEPKLPRAVFIGLWVFYYLPKAPIAAVLGVKDALRFTSQRTGRPSKHVAAGPEGDAMTRSEFLQRLGWSLALVPFGVVGNGVVRRLYDYKVHRVTLRLEHLPPALDGLTIVQLSDLHAGSFLDAAPLREAFALAGELKGDVILITGDFVNHDAAEMDLLMRPLADMKADVGVFACLGNHDHYADVADVSRRVRAAGVDLMVNEHRTIQIDGARLNLIGTDNTGFRQHFADLERARAGLKPAPDRDFNVLLAHDPTFWDSHVRPGHSDIDLMMCGHTHGGQIGFELGPLRWGLARMMYDRWAGLYTDRSPSGRLQYLYVNRGIGTVGPAIRIGIRPEITYLTLRRG